MPRNLAFLFSRNRLNVAISRAQCLAYLVCSPRLLEARCNSIEEMELVNALCRLAEYASADRFNGYLTPFAILSTSLSRPLLPLDMPSDLK